MDHRLYFAFGAVACAVALAASLLTGKTLNVINRGGPFLVARAKNPGLYWAGLVIVGMLFVFNSLGAMGALPF